MILVRLMGGLGNQMFQYAAGKAAALRTGDTLVLDHSLVGPPKDGNRVDPIRTFDLDVFGLQDRLASPFEVALFNGHPDSLGLKVIHRVAHLTRRFPLLMQKDNVFTENLLNRRRGNVCLVGRWQSESYFTDHANAIRDEFAFRHLDPLPYARRVVEQCIGEECVAIQTRRADYVTHPVYSRSLGALTAQYYLEAIDAVRSRLSQPHLKIYVGGDDMDWCAATFGKLSNVVLLDQEKSKRGYCSHMWMLSHFRHHVISNSTFAWWAAWLGEKPDSVIVTPAQWTRDDTKPCERLIPARWISIENEFEPLP